MILRNALEPNISYFYNNNLRTMLLMMLRHLMFGMFESNSSKYQVLSYVARDAFAIPITIVALESTFRFCLRGPKSLLEDPLTSRSLFPP